MGKWKESEKSIKLAVDTIIEKENKVVLIRHAIGPHKGRLGTPGGMVEYGETIEKAALRETREETGLKVKLLDILGVYSDPKRDPRFHAVAICFIAKLVGGKLKNSFEGEVDWYDTRKLNFKDFGFDHGKMLKDYIKWKKKKGTYWSTRI